MVSWLMPWKQAKRDTYRTPPAPNRFNVFPFDYISAKDQYDGCTAEILIGGGPGYICQAPNDPRTCHASGRPIDQPLPPIIWKIVYINDTQFQMFANGDPQKPANHAWSHDNLSAFPYDTSDSRTFFSMYIVDGQQIGMKAYEYDWPSSGLYALYNDTYAGLSCAWGSMNNPSMTPIFKIVSQSAYVQKFTTTDIGYQMQCCTQGDALTGLDARVCADRKLNGQNTACDELMQQYCSTGRNIDLPICSCFKISQQLQSNPQLAPLSISPICVAPCTNSGYRTLGFTQEANGGCGKNCVQIQNLSDQVTAQNLLQTMTCPGGTAPQHIVNPTTPSGGSMPSPTPIPTPFPSPATGGSSTIVEYWNNSPAFRYTTYGCIAIVVLYVVSSMFFTDDDTQSQYVPEPEPTQYAQQSQSPQYVERYGY